MDVQTEAIRFYCGVREGQWNRDPVRPGSYVCRGILHRQEVQWQQWQRQGATRQVKRK